MKFFLTVSSLALFCLSAHASPPPIDPNFCQALARHTPDADVAYQPGIDVHGRAVAPADLPGTNTFQIQQPVTIPLTANLMKVLNFPATDYPFNTMKRTEINLGTLTVDGEKVLYNGQPLTNDQQDKLAVLCMKPNK